MDIKDNKDVALAIPGLSDISSSYMEDFLSEIREILEDIELELVNLEMDPGNKESINSIYCSFHTISGLAGLLNDPTSTKIAVATEELLETVKKYSPAVSKSIINVILDSINFIKRISSNPQIVDDHNISGEIGRHIKNLQTFRDDILLEVRQPLEKQYRIGEILVREGAIAQSEVEDILKKQSHTKMKFGEIVLREKKVNASDIIKAIRMQKIRNMGTSDQYVKIPLDRLDQIIGIIQNVSSIYDSVKNEAVLRFGSNDSLTIESTKAYHLITDIRNILKELRMVTLQQAFQKLTRAVCSIIEENHMEVMFSTMGENIEVDKEVADRIALPLGEMVRLLLEKAYINGRENTSRNPKEKQQIGSIEIVAYEEANTVHIDITGDAVMDLEEIKTDSRYIDNLQKLSSLRCHTDIDDINGEGVRISITLQR
jgi:two-component system chemotaxis sensor kinase CheA